jgi:hypothetical protein
MYGIVACFFIIILVVVYVTLVAGYLFKFFTYDLVLSFILPHSFDCSWSCFGQVLKIPLRVVNLVNIGFCTGMILMFALVIVVGFSLNAEYFNPFVASFLSLVLFFWKNWKVTVEGRFLELKTSTIEICEKKADDESVQSTDNGKCYNKIQN